MKLVELELQNQSCDKIEKDDLWDESDRVVLD